MRVNGKQSPTPESQGYLDFSSPVDSSVLDAEVDHCGYVEALDSDDDARLLASSDSTDLFLGT